MKQSREFEAFTDLVDRVLSVPHSAIKERIAEERKRIDNNPSKPGPKPKRKVKKPSA
jgi:predicted nucleic acid-binding OB-fold protein